MATGLVYVFTGEGKGKTSAALGVATRSLLLDKRVVWIAFYKGSDWDLAEKKLAGKFQNLEMYFTGKGFRIVNSEQKISSIEGKEIKLASVGEHNKVVDTATEDEHLQAARHGLELVKQKLETKPFLLVMDEILNAISEGIVMESDVIDVIKKRGKTHIVLTGRGLTDQVLQESDLVTECTKIKHPYDKNILAIRGLDF